MKVSIIYRYHISFLSYLFLCQHFIRFVFTPFAQCCNIKCRWCVLAHVLPHANYFPCSDCSHSHIFPCTFLLTFFSLVILFPTRFHTYQIYFFLLIQICLSFPSPFFSPPCFPTLFYNLSFGFLFPFSFSASPLIS